MPNGYTEKHHILPKCIFSEYINQREFPWNIKKLSPEDHFIAHYILYKLIPSRMTYPWILMWAHKSKKMARSYSEEFLRKYAEEYANAKRNKVISIETRLKISKANKGKIRSEETKRKMSEALKLRICKEDTRKKRSEIHKGKIVSEETKKKMSNSQKLRDNTVRGGFKHSEESKAKISAWSKLPRKRNKKAAKT